VMHVVRIGVMRSAYNFVSDNLEGRDNLEDLNVDGRISLKGILKKCDDEGLNWIHLAQDRD